MKKQILRLLALIGLVTMLSACGGAGGASTNISVTLSDFHFTPDTFTVPAGQQITLNVVNSGAVEHEFVIFKLGTDAGDKFGPEDEPNIYWTLNALPGESKSVTFTAPSAPGEYYLTCGIPGHLEAGMSGKLIVVAK